MSSQGHYSPCTDDPLFGYSTGKMVEAKNLNHPTISTCTFSQSIQMASQTSPRLFKIQTWGCEVLWRHMTPCDSLHLLHSVIRFARRCLRVSEKHELSFHPPLFFRPLCACTPLPIYQTARLQPQMGKTGPTLQERHQTSPPHLTQSGPV